MDAIFDFLNLTPQTLHLYMYYTIDYRILLRITRSMITLKHIYIYSVTIIHIPRGGRDKGGENRMGN